MSEPLTAASADVALEDRLYHSNKLREHLVGRRTLLAKQQAKLPAGVNRARPRVTIRVDNDIPRLAWLAVVKPAQRCTIIVGRDVEVAAHSIFEGVWDGAFNERDFARSQYTFGSGVAWGRRLVFVPPRHSWEYLYVLVDRRRGHTLISNSMNFALEAGHVSGSSALMKNLARDLFEKTNASTRVGVDKYDPFVAGDDHYTFYRMIFYNFTADAAGHIELLPGLAPEAPFTDFASYRDYLVSKIKRIGENATDPARKHPLPPITPVSNGYDSACVAVLAQEAGWHDAVTLDVEVNGRSDSGVGISQRLGLNLSKVEHVYGKIVPKLDGELPMHLTARANEFIATPGVGDDLTFAAMEHLIAGRSVLSGALGDSIWQRNSSLPPGLPVRVIYGKSLTEFRLRAGFAWVPVPSIGARFPRRVKRITRSAEMQPWTLWRSYDRPIPRRVVEDRGVPREEFGSAKSATSPTITNHAALFLEAVTAIRARYANAIGDERRGLSVLLVRGLRRLVRKVLRR